LDFQTETKASGKMLGLMAREDRHLRWDAGSVGFAGVRPMPLTDAENIQSGLRRRSPGGQFRFDDQHWVGE
jgi:hypothetical protein